MASSASYTVKEEVRISFTKKLHQLREGTLDIAVFPSTLNNIERKFLHKLAEELGLNSKSKGTGENRYISVWKTAAGDEKKSELTLSKEVVSLLQSSAGSLISSSGLMNDGVATGSTGDSQRSSASTNRTKLANQLKFLGESYRAAQAARASKPDYANIQRKRSLLPVFQHKSAVCSLVEKNQIVLISGETGCGKTTQVPQFIFDDESIGPSCRIAVTQPRRLSAISVAERIAAERSEKIGHTVGYNIRLESEKSASTQILFVTPGLLIRKLQTDPLLEEFSHIVIDEAHERDRFTEFLMIVLRDICSRRKDLKLILMSATLHTTKLSSYFGSCPHIHMGGSVFPVQEFHLEHVLRYTNYLSSRANSNAGGAGGLISRGASADGSALTGASHVQAMTQFIESNQKYQCTLCNSSQVFKSPEELGTHAAFCYGVKESGSDKFNYAKGKNAQNNVGNRRPELKELFKSYQKAQNDTITKETASAKGKKLLGALQSSAAPAPAAAAVGKKSTKATAAAAAASASATAVTKSTVDEMDDVDVDDDDDDVDDSDDDDDVAAGIESAPDGAVSGATDVSMDIGDTSSLDNDLLRAYQASWDDSQVDYDLITSLLQYIVTSEFIKSFSTTGRNGSGGNAPAAEAGSGSGGGSILIFMPGWDDISKMYRQLTCHPIFGNTAKFKVMQLHSGIPKNAQHEIFNPVASNQHKIILSTNIAETSITIDDVTVVIDTGRVKEKTYDPHTKLSFLKSTWISQASGRQRKGRAGRTCAGVCFHMFSKVRSKNMAEFQDSELLRMPLEELVLQTKILGIAPGEKDEADSAQSFLLNALDPPHILSITNAIQLLQMISCLDERERITPIGKAVSRLPMDPKISRMVLIGCLCGCGPALLTTTATMAYRDPFLMPNASGGSAAAVDARRDSGSRIKQKLANGVPSDQYVVLRAMEQYSMLVSRFGVHKANQFCDEQNLSRGTMHFLNELTSQLNRAMKEVGINMQQNRITKNNGNANLVSSLIGMALYPDIGVRNNNAAYCTEKGRKAMVHPSSLNFKASMLSKKSKVSDVMKVMAFQDLISAANSNNRNPGAATLMMLSTTPINTFAMLMAAGVVKELPPVDDIANTPPPVAEGADGSAAPMVDDDSDDEAWAAAAANINVDGSTATSATVSPAPSTPNTPVYLEVDGWITIKVTKQVAEYIFTCRKGMSDALEFFVNACQEAAEAEEHNASSNSRGDQQVQQQQLPYHLVKVLDVITQALSIEQKQLQQQHHELMSSAGTGSSDQNHGQSHHQGSSAGNNRRKH